MFLGAQRLHYGVCGFCIKVALSGLMLFPSIRVIFPNDAVSLMHKIHQSGDSNLIYIGDDSNKTETSQFLRDIQLNLEDMRREMNDFRDLVQTTFTADVVRRFAYSGLSIELENWSSLEIFLSNA